MWTPACGLLEGKEHCLLSKDKYKALAPLTWTHFPNWSSPFNDLLNNIQFYDLLKKYQLTRSSWVIDELEMMCLSKHPVFCILKGCSCAFNAASDETAVLSDTPAHYFPLPIFPSEKQQVCCQSHAVIKST